MASWRARRWVLLDVILTTVVLGIGLAEIVTGQLSGPLPVSIGAVLALTASQVVRRRHVWISVVLAFGAIAGSDALGVQQGNFIASVIACLAAIATAGYELERRGALLALVFGFGCVAASVARDLSSLSWLVVVIGGPWAAGRALRARRLLIDDLRTTTAELERSRLELADRAVEAERLRIAQEVHDIISHTVTVMTVQADAAERTARTDLPTALASIRAVQETGREAQAQLRQLLGVLRPDGPPAVDSGGVLEPQPQLSAIGPLVDRFRAAGLGVDYCRSTESADVPAVVALTAYRIVQEALTNVLRHSAAESASVRLAASDARLAIEVEDPGPPRPADSETDPGHGLPGMRERVAACGGVFTAATTTTGGFLVAAELPVEPRP